MPSVKGPRHTVIVTENSQVIGIISEANLSGGGDFWIIFVIYVSCLSCFLVTSLQPCGHLLGKGLSLGSLVCDVYCDFVTFSCGVLGQVWYLIVLIPDRCLLTYFVIWLLSLL